MSLKRMMSIPCSIVTREDTGEVDRYGDPITKEVTVETNCAFQQDRRAEHEDGGEVSDTRWLLYLPWGTTIGSGASIVVNEREYEVQGEVWEAQEGSRSMWHIEATCTRKAGTGES